MRKFKSLLLMAVLLILAVSCGKKHEISLSPTSYEFDPHGGDLTVEITTDGDWNVEKCPEWVSTTQTSGSKNASIVLTAMPNLENVVREGIFEVSTSDKSAQLQLSQGVVTEDYLSVSPDSITVDYHGGEFDLQVLSNCEWSLSTLSQLFSGITVNPTSGQGNQTVKVTVGKYESSDESSSREATLVFVGANTIVRVKIIQSDGSEVAVGVDPCELNFPAEGGTQQLNVTCTSNWIVSASVSWLSVSAAEGLGDGQITVTAEANELYQSRFGDVIFTSDAGQTTRVAVSQDAAVDPHHLDVSPLEVNFTKQGGSAVITVGCDEMWKVDCPEHWISLSVPDGVGDGSFEITAEENILNSPRNTVVYMVSGALERQIRISQEAGDETPYVSLNVDTLYVDAIEDVFNIEVSSNVAWNVRGSDWAEPLQNSGEGDGIFPVRIHANYETTPRTCTVRVSALGATASFVVIQSGYVYTLETSLTELIAPADGMKTEISVFANQNWTVSKGASWILYDPVSGSNDGAITIVIDANMFPADRSAEIFVTGEKDGLVIINVTQPHAK